MKAVKNVNIYHSEMLRVLTIICESRISDLKTLKLNKALYSELWTALEKFLSNYVMVSKTTRSKNGEIKQGNLSRIESCLKTDRAYERYDLVQDRLVFIISKADHFLGSEPEAALNYIYRMANNDLTSSWRKRKGAVDISIDDTDEDGRAPHESIPSPDNSHFMTELMYISKLRIFEDADKLSKTGELFVWMSCNWLYMDYSALLNLIKQKGCTEAYNECIYRLISSYELNTSAMLDALKRFPELTANDLHLHKDDAEVMKQLARLKDRARLKCRGAKTR